MLPTKSQVNAAVLEQHLQHRVEERRVPADVDREEVISDLRAEDGRSPGGRHPVALQARLAVRVDHDDLAAALLGHVEVLHEHGLLVGRVSAEDHRQVRLDHVRVGARGRGHAEGLLESARARRVADPRRVVDVVGAQEARHLLGDVVDLVGDATRGQVEGDAVRRRGAMWAAREGERLVPARCG